LVAYFVAPNKNIEPIGSVQHKIDILAVLAILIVYLAYVLNKENFVFGYCGKRFKTQ
jgi:hypothetical protein